MEPSTFVGERVDLIVDSALAALTRRHLAHYERLGRDAAVSKLRDLLDHVIEAARTRHLRDILDYAERIGRERYESGFDFVEVQAAVNLVEEAVWRAVLDGYPAAEQGTALGIIATIFGATKDRLASIYLSLATQTHVPSLDLASLFRGTQNTGGGAFDERSEASPVGVGSDPASRPAR